MGAVPIFPLIDEFRRRLKACMATYYESLMTSDPEGVRSVFHENARITGRLPDGLHQMTVEEFAGFVHSRQPSPDASGAERMLEVEGAWKIYSKLFHVEG